MSGSGRTEKDVLEDALSSVWLEPLSVAPGCLRTCPPHHPQSMAVGVVGGCCWPYTGMVLDVRWGNQHVLLSFLESIILEPIPHTPIRRVSAHKPAPPPVPSTKAKASETWRLALQCCEYNTRGRSPPPWGRRWKVPFCCWSFALKTGPGGPTEAACLFLWPQGGRKYAQTGPESEQRGYLIHSPPP